jgi:hypothetical protein
VRFVVTWVCTTCHRGWPLAVTWMPHCTRCLQPLKPRGPGYYAIPLERGRADPA